MSEAIRLTFRFEGDKVTLKSARRMRMRVPPGECDLEADTDPAIVGKWFEVRGAKGRCLYRRFVAEFIPEDAEIQTGDPEQAFRRVPAAPDRGICTVLVPVLAGARTVRLLEHKPPSRKTKGARLGVVTHADVDLASVDIESDESERGQP